VEEGILKALEFGKLKLFISTVGPLMYNVWVEAIMQVKNNFVRAREANVIGAS
jgi:hypothetical protein